MPRWSTGCQPRALGEAFLGPARPRTLLHRQVPRMFTFKPHKLSSSAVSTSGEEGREVGAAVETGFRRV